MFPIVTVPESIRQGLAPYRSLFVHSFAVMQELSISAGM
jgi:hypothetical protein